MTLAAWHRTGANARIPGSIRSQSGISRAAMSCPLTFRPIPPYSRAEHDETAPFIQSSCPQPAVEMFNRPR